MTTSTAEPVVDVCGVDVWLGGRQVLHGIDLVINPGEVVTLLGGNGSGKSTLVRAIVGLVPVAQGDIQLFGTALHEFRDWRRVGYVPQRITATSGVPATVQEVVSTGRLSRMRPFGRWTRDDAAAVERALALVGLVDRANDSVAELSGGQQQRVLIARAAAGEPDLFILDEPTAAVDHPSQQAFARALESFVQSGRTVLLVLHELGLLAPLVDRAIVLRYGKTTFDGPVELVSGVNMQLDADHQHPHATTEPEGLFG
jgi:zinc transport system ATP-binding protein